MQREVQERPDLLSDGPKVLFGHPVEVDHVQEVQDEDRADNVANGGGFELENALGLDDSLTGLRETHDALAENDKRKKRHALYQVSACERSVSGRSRAVLTTVVLYVPLKLTILQIDDTVVAIAVSSIATTYQVT